MTSTMDRKRRGSICKEHPNFCDLRIVLFGKNETENSRVGNLILGKDLHEIDEPKAFQKRCFKISGTVENRHVTVINTLHLLKPNNHQITQTVCECMNLSDPGPHVFILVLQYNDFTEEDMTRVRHVLKEFSEEALKRTIVITTDESPTKKHTSIYQLTKECGEGHLHLGIGNPELKSYIFQRIDKILKGNLEEYLTCDICHDVKTTSVDEEQNNSEEEKSSYHKDDAKPKSQKKRSEGNLFFKIRKQTLSSNPPKMLANFSGKQKKLNLVVCGSDGSLKVSVSKLLRGKKINRSHQRVCSEECVKREEKVHGCLISLVELPALSRLSEEEVMSQILCCVSLCDPGVHAFLFIIPDAPLNNDNKEEIEKIQNIFYSREHFMILFTTEKTKSDKSVAEFVKSSPESQRLISRCGGQYRVIGLKEPENSRQIPELLDYIENMKIDPFTLQMYVKAQENRARRETKEELKKMENEIKELQEKVQSEGAESEAGDLKCLRIVLIGKTGSGKSATGNTILGRNEFHSRLSTDSVTTVCQKRVGEVDGRSVAVVDTPGLFDTTLTNEHVVEEIVKCVSLSSPGPHVFVIVLSVGRFTREEMDTVDLIKKIFGPKAAQFSIVLFTRGDDLKNESIQDYVRKSNSAELKKLIRDCGNRFLVFNNNENQDRTQVIQLLNMIEDLKHINEGQYFTSRMFEEAEMSIKKKMEEILKDKEREIQNQREMLEAKYEREMKNMMKRLEEEKQRADEERINIQNQFREKEEKLREELEEKEKTEWKNREVGNQKQSEEEKQQRDEYHRKIEEMKREIKNKRSKQQKEREEDRKREEEYRKDLEKMKNEQEQITSELKIKQEEETKKRESEEKRRNKEEEEERKRWKIKIKESENDRKEIQDEIKRQQREWEDEKKRQMREREEEERKRKEKNEEQLREKQEELEKMRERFEKEREAERQKIEEERQKQRREREEKEREYEEKKNNLEKHYKRLEEERNSEWERRKQEEEERREEERKRWERKIEDLKREQEEEIKRREREENERKEREGKERDEIKQLHEEEIEDVKKKHEEEARKQAAEFHESTEIKLKHVLELTEMLKEWQEQHKTLEK